MSEDIIVSKVAESIVRYQDEVIKSVIDELGITLEEALGKLDVVFTQMNHYHQNVYEMFIVDKETRKILRQCTINIL